MRMFTINSEVVVACESLSTRTGFKHVATLLINGVEVDKVKCCYQNRTWERYQFESVLYKLLDSTKKLDGDQRVDFKTLITNLN